MHIIESCHSTWVFDAERMRFRRIVKFDTPGHYPVSTEWRPYFGLETDRDGDAFIVLLNRDGTQLLRSWRHTTDCRQCGAHVTAEMALAGLHGAPNR